MTPVGLRETLHALRRVNLDRYGDCRQRRRPKAGHGTEFFAVSEAVLASTTVPGIKLRWVD
jgi:hypothetical protein